MSNIVLTKSFLLGLQKAYEKAVKDGKTQFEYDGHEFVTTYAKYFIQFHGPRVGLKLTEK